MPIKGHLVGFGGFGNRLHTDGTDAVTVERFDAAPRIHSRGAILSIFSGTCRLGVAEFIAASSRTLLPIGIIYLLTRVLPVSTYRR